MNKLFFRSALAAACVLASAGVADAQSLLGSGAALGDQSSTRNSGVIVQSGRGNAAALGQQGANNAGSITQVGSNNDACLYQHGRNLSGGISQVGDNQTVAYVQTNMGMRPVLMSTCRAQVAAGSPRNIVIPPGYRMRPGR